MKASRNQMNRQNKQGFSKKPVPEIRDDLDSREGEEFQKKEDMMKGKKLKQDKSGEKKRQG